MRPLQYVKKPRSQNSCVSMQEKEINNEENPLKKGKQINPDGFIREIPAGKGLGATLTLYRDRGTFKKSTEGRESDGKRDDGEREIIIERRDEFGNVMNAKEAFRRFCINFHVRKPSKTKLEKRILKNEREKKVMQLSNNPQESMVLMDNALKAAQKPFLVLDGKKSAVKKSCAAVPKCLHGREGQWLEKQDPPSRKRTRT